MPNLTTSLDGLLHALAAHRSFGRKIVFTNGCFDLLHAGHRRLLQEAASLGDVLIVAVNSDASVGQLKGSNRPIVAQAHRAAALAAGQGLCWERPLPARRDSVNHQLAIHLFAQERHRGRSLQTPTRRFSLDKALRKRRGDGQAT